MATDMTYEEHLAAGDQFDGPFCPMCDGGHGGSFCPLEDIADYSGEPWWAQ